MTDLLRSLTHLVFESSPFAFPVFFLLVWLAATTTLGAISGWYRLAARYRDRSETPLLNLKNRSGSLGLVGMRSILSLGVCPSGLRVGITRIFGPFCRDFFVPWEAISVHREDGFWWSKAVLELGRPTEGRLTLSAELANRLARAAAERWPEAGPFPEESDAQAISRIFKEWALTTVLAAAFFIIAPRLAFPPDAAPPILVAVLFPAIVLGVASVVRYARRRR
jgi:hypothetical protein